ncbi:MAG: cytochrome c oxidase subunit II [Bacillaceae bacterium]|nr:cytochrome c oxidase subunit II [Bacillaceae bacterium]
MKKGNLWRLLFLVSTLALVLTGCGDPELSALDPKGTGADMQLDLIMLSLYIMLGVMAVVIVIFTYVLIRYRQRPGDNHIPKQVEGNTKLEIIWTVIPIILLIILAVPTVYQTFVLAEDAAETTEDPVEIKVTAHQYWWEVEYPEYEIVTAQDIYIPAGERVHIELTSVDVIHSFWVPALGGKMDANPGLVNEMWLEAKQPGTYKGKCAELCGASHAKMDFKVVALERDQFEKWVADMKEPAPEPTTVSAQEGKQLFENNCMACHATDAGQKSLGPNLNGIADRKTIAGFMDNDKENLEKWITDPAARDVKPGSSGPKGMPAFHDKLTEEEISKVAEYLQTLTIE